MSAIHAVQICDFVLIFRNTVDNTRTLQWRSADGLSRHTGNGSMYLRAAGGLHRPAALASSAKQATAHSACCAQRHQRTGVICQRLGTY